MSLQSTELWQLQSPQVAAIERIVQQLQFSNASGATSATGFIYDGSGRLTEFMADGVLVTVSYPDSTHINVAYGLHSIAITLNASQQVIGVLRS